MRTNADKETSDTSINSVSNLLSPIINEKAKTKLKQVD